MQSLYPRHLLFSRTSRSPLFAFKYRIILLQQINTLDCCGIFNLKISENKFIFHASYTLLNLHKVINGIQLPLQRARYASITTRYKRLGWQDMHGRQKVLCVNLRPCTTESNLRRLIQNDRKITLASIQESVAPTRYRREQALR